MHVHECLKNLIDFIEENDITDEEANDGDEYIDAWRSTKFDSLITDAKEILQEGRHLP